MSGGFKWLELGIHHVVADDRGRILCYIVVDAPNARRCPIPAFVEGKQIGTYLTDKQAREACEDAMSDRRRVLGMDAGRTE